MNINEIFLLINNIIKGADTKPSKLWVYMEDEKGLPCPLPSLNGYIHRYAKDKSDKMCFFTCHKPSRHKQKFVVNLRDLLVYARDHLTPDEAVMAFMLHIVLDAIIDDNDVEPSLITQISIWVNALFIHEQEK